MSGDFILCDTSLSMDTPVGFSRRIDVVGNVLKMIRGEFPNARLIAFNSTFEELHPNGSLPALNGSTALELPLRWLADQQPRRVAVLSDGAPNSKEAALAAATALRCYIATYFCGNDEDWDGIGFMRALAFCSADGVGHASVTPLRDPAQLTTELRLLLTHGESR